MRREGDPPRRCGGLHHHRLKRKGEGYSLRPSVDLESMTKAQLAQYAAENGIEGVSTSMLKADMIAAIRAAESE